MWLNYLAGIWPLLWTGLRPPPHLYVEALNPKVLAFEVGVKRGHKDGALIR